MGKGRGDWGEKEVCLIKLGGAKAAVRDSCGAGGDGGGFNIHEGNTALKK